MFYGRSILIIKQIKLLKVARPTGVFQATLKIAVVLHSGNINGLTIFMCFFTSASSAFDDNYFNPNFSGFHPYLR